MKFPLVTSVVFGVAVLVTSPVRSGAGSAAADDAKLSTFVMAEVTTRMASDGVEDKGRLFIFSFYYRNSMGDIGAEGEYCQLNIITVNNVDCKMKSPTAFWLKQEYFDKAYAGDEFTCKLNPINDKKWELVVNQPIDEGGEIVHRVVVTRGRNDNLNKVVDLPDNFLHSFLTNRIEVATYRPIRGEKGYGLEDIACSSIEVPVIPK